jgi:hypothetical protein
MLSPRAIFFAELYERWSVQVPTGDCPGTESVRIIKNMIDRYLSIKK